MLAAEAAINFICLALRGCSRATLSKQVKL
jgi:hypothetical protein